MTSVIEREGKVPRDGKEGRRGIFRLARPEILEVKTEGA